MRTSKYISLLLGLTLVLPLTIRADQDRDRKDRDDRDCEDREHFEHSAKTPVHLIGAITLPGNPLSSADIAWVDPGTERYYVADRSNFGVDIIDAEESDPLAFSYVGRVIGMAGPLPSGGGTALTNGPGPNGALVTPNRHLWAGDGNSIVQVADVDPSSAGYLNIVRSISTSISACDAGPGPTGHYCGRADEIGYDPKDHLILIANPSPLSKVAPHAPIAPYATFIDASTYAVLGNISFPGSGGLEQPLWDAGLGKFLLTVPGVLGTTLPMIAVINPTTRMVERSISIDCVNNASIKTASASITGIALAPYQHVLVAACGWPIVLNAVTGHIYNVIKQVGGGDEVWYNSGDGRFYVTGPPNGVGLAVDAQLGVIDAQKGKWLQNVPVPRGRNPAAFSENNRIFAFSTVTAAMVADPTTDTSVCATKFGIKGRGCIAVFSHAGEKEDDDK